MDTGITNLSQDGTGGKYQAIVYIDSTNGYDCSASGDVKKLTGNPKKFAIKGYIEAGGSNGDFICIESHI